LIDLHALYSILMRYGLIGVFLVSMISNAIPYTTVPYLLFIAVYTAATGRTPEHVLLVSLSGGVGAAVGKIAVYYVGRGFARLLPKSTRASMEQSVKLLRKSVFLIILLAAATPIPDDVVNIPASIVGYDVLRYFTAVVLGKILLTGVAASLGSAASLLIEEPSSIPLHIAIPVLILVSTYITYLVVKIDWVTAARKAEEEGAKGLLKYITLSTLHNTAELFKGFAKLLKKTQPHH